MTTSSRRFEILLPTRFNDGQPVPDEPLADTLLELRQQFGAVSSETQIIRGLWEHQGQSYRDDLVRVFVDVPDVPESRQFFLEFNSTGAGAAGRRRRARGPGSGARGC
jgi:hypothetical protein